MTFKNYNQTGLSLIEVLVASGVFIIGLMAMLSSGVAMLSATRFSKNYLIATGLAREAIEVVKNKRDDNYLHHSAFDSGLVGLSQAIIKFDNPDFNGHFEITAIEHDIDACIANKACQLKFFPSKNLYGNGTITGDSGELVNFYRLLTFQDIFCQDAVPTEWIGTNPDDLCNTGDKVGLTVTTTVKWYDNKLQFLEIANKLYDWQ